MSTLKIVFMGTPDFAVAQAEACAAHGTLVAVVSQPDRPVGRHQTLEPTPTRRWAEARGVPVLQPAKVKNGLLAEAVRPFAPDVIVVAAYGRILPADVLALPPLGALNVHASLLPKYRGAAPIQWAIARGERETGVTIMQMDEGLDTGAVRLQRAIPIEPTDTSATMHDKLARLGAAALGEALGALAAGTLPRVPQDASQMTLAPILSRDDARVDWTRPAAELDCRLRGFTPWPGAFFLDDGKTVKVHAAHPQIGCAVDPPGTVLELDASGVRVNTGAGAWRLALVQPEGAKRMPASAWAAGRRLAPGARLT